MRFCPLLEFGDVCLQFVGRYVFAKHTTIPARQKHDVQVDTPHVVNHIAEFNGVLLILHLKLI